MFSTKLGEFWKPPTGPPSRLDFVAPNATKVFGKISLKRLHQDLQTPG